MCVPNFTAFFSVQELKECVVCKKKIVNLQRHLKNVHKFSDEDARMTIGAFQLRKSYARKKKFSPKKKGKDSKQQKWKDYHHTRICPQCFKPLKHLGEHLVKHHGYIKDKKYYHILNTASKVMDVPDVSKSPKSFLRTIKKVAV